MVKKTETLKSYTLGDGELSKSVTTLQPYIHERFIREKKPDAYVSKGRTKKKTTSYLVTLSLKVGGGQDEITLLGAAKIVTRW